jgi:phospholipid/cholesterol/gamma-HCH transport system ATP-binding protein
MTIRENLLFPARRNPQLKKLSEKELNERVEYTLESVGLIDAIEKLPAELSGGMKKRAGLARALMRLPELIIYDEPTTGLDPYTAAAINELIMNIRERYNTSSIIITHDITCAKLTSDRMLIMHEGRIIAEGTFKELENETDPQIQLFFNYN